MAKKRIVIRPAHVGAAAWVTGMNTDELTQYIQRHHLPVQPVIDAYNNCAVRFSQGPHVKGYEEPRRMKIKKKRPFDPA